MKVGLRSMNATPESVLNFYDINAFLFGLKKNVNAIKSI
jgi:hypothetical protein